MLYHRTLSHDDLATIITFPESKEELFYVSPKFVYPLTPEQILALLENRVEPTVVRDDESDDVLAYANLYDKDDQEGTCWLGNVIVSPRHRGKGVSDFLLFTMMEKAKVNYGLKKMQLFCHNTNSKGLAFYDKHGFKPVGLNISKTEPVKYIAIKMERDL
ncbi:GNAT family N-acetyltransferase [Paenibacillus nasutitermitis]|uniref:N-acetyltransferase domain-containing protein n=1 Tax=Paenibacillus nasutitermitis TaxID=1652958 RepID=A0A916ZG44_9BACL|nr:GNAT family N-acetyltransferase [Paenibacillus nasutitermitis]GGD93986.1 hypothetical protein GCM10010911_60850 [Paenibacillus nasutitermitis]